MIAQVAVGHPLGSPHLRRLPVSTLPSSRRAVYGAERPEDTAEAGYVDRASWRFIGKPSETLNRTALPDRARIHRALLLLPTYPQVLPQNSAH